MVCRKFSQTKPAFASCLRRYGELLLPAMLGLFARSATARTLRCARVPARSMAIRSDSIVDIFNTMEYGPAPEADDGMQAWLQAHDNHFGLFINGEWRHPEGRSVAKSYAPATGDQIAFITQANKSDADDAIAAPNGVFQGAPSFKSPPNVPIFLGTSRSR